jgi:thioesterase domain-containing protein/acyl carrier protein
MHHPQTPQSDRAFLANTLGRLWLSGVKINWTNVYPGEARRRIPLPTYPFERQRYWIDAAPTNGHRPVTSTRTRSGALVPEASRTPAKIDQRHARSALQTAYAAPQDKTEESIAEIWQDLFRIKLIGVNDNFFELGGSSLLAIRHNNRLQQSLGVSLSPNMLIKLPTVAQLAEFVKSNGPTDQPAPVEVERKLFAPLLEMKAGKREQPLILVPPLGGGLFGYRYLVDRLNTEKAVFGVQAPALAGEADPFETIQQEGAHGVKALQALQPEGPYFVAGASYGGAVAFEMAHQLRSQHHEVALLALFDSPHPAEMDVDPNDDAQLLTTVLRVLLEGDSPVSVAELQKLSPVEQVDYAIEKVRVAGKIPPDVDLAQARQIANLWKWNIKALLAYQPEHYDGRVTYFRAAERRERQVRFPEIPWTEISDGGIEIHVVPGDHYSIFEPPHVDVLAAKMNVLLNWGRAR